MARGFTGGGFDMSLPRLICELRSAGIAHVVITDGMHGDLKAKAVRLDAAGDEMVLGEYFVPRVAVSPHFTRIGPQHQRGACWG